KTGRSGGSWNGPGITSSIAAADSTHTTGLDAVINDKGDGTALLPTIDSEPADANVVLVRYGPNGDLDLNGKVNGADYFLIDNGFLNQLAGYHNGDIDGNGKVDGADYFLIDSAFLTQGSPAAASAQRVLRHKQHHGRSHHHRVVDHAGILSK